MGDFDASEKLKVLDSFWQQCLDASHVGKDIKIEPPMNAIMVAGVGGSGVPGDILQAYLNVKVPVLTIKDYILPSFANQNTLVFVCSYSGNTEEALEALKEGLKRKCKLVGMSAGGKLKDLCIKHRVPHILIPYGIQPRDAIGYLTFPILNILRSSSVIPDPAKDMQETVDILKKDQYKEEAQELAKRLVGKIPLIYASTKLKTIAERWKSKINEDAKVHAFYNVFPEWNHNELVGYTYLKGDYYVIMIQDHYDHPRIKKRMEVTKELLQKKGCPVLMLKLRGNNILSKIFSSLLLGSYVSYYLALEYGVDPTPVTVIEELKKELAK